jgi:sulfur carrier protein
MRLKVNGKPLEAEPGTTVRLLLEGMALPSPRVAVAVNGEVSPRSEHARRVLRDGDEIEVIHAVAGG